ncbi:MAG TPA: hypothetical protein VM529_08195, partial [Gemmata sp.]|nr:hypothetical protein [Gemmata sp.]
MAARDDSPKVALAFPLRPGPWPAIVRGVYRYAAAQSPRWLLSLHTGEDPDAALAGRPDGVIAMVRTREAAAKLAAWGGPVVDTAADLKTHPFARVYLDPEGVGRAAADYLLRERGRGFAYVGDRSTLAGECARYGSSNSPG